MGMKDLYKALGYELVQDQTQIKLQRCVDYRAWAEEQKRQMANQSYWTIGGITHYNPSPQPTVIWEYKTWFGVQLEQYNASKYQSSGHIFISPSTQISPRQLSSPWGGLTVQGHSVYSGLSVSNPQQLISQSAQQQQMMAQQAALQSHMSKAGQLQAQNIYLPKGSFVSVDESANEPAPEKKPETTKSLVEKFKEKLGL